MASSQRSSTPPGISTLDLLARCAVHDDHHSRFAAADEQPFAGGVVRHRKVLVGQLDGVVADDFVLFGINDLHLADRGGIGEQAMVVDIELEGLRLGRELDVFQLREILALDDVHAGLGVGDVDAAGGLVIAEVVGFFSDLDRSHELVAVPFKDVDQSAAAQRGKEAIEVRGEGKTLNAGLALDLPQQLAGF